jgi:hypothetical protein
MMGSRLAKQRLNVYICTPYLYLGLELGSYYVRSCCFGRIVDRRVSVGMFVVVAMTMKSTDVDIKVIECFVLGFCRKCAVSVHSTSCMSSCGKFPSEVSQCVRIDDKPSMSLSIKRSRSTCIVFYTSTHLLQRRYTAMTRLCNPGTADTMSHPNVIE